MIDEDAPPPPPTLVYFSVKFYASDRLPLALRQSCQRTMKSSALSSSLTPAATRLLVVGLTLAQHIIETRRSRTEVISSTVAVSLSSYFHHAYANKRERRIKSN